MAFGSGPRRGPWDAHPAVRSGKELSLGERAADAMRSGMGSWLFVGGFALFMALWMGGNGRGGFDPFPFILLNLMLSTLAGLQGAILLIAAKRADQMSTQLAQHAFETGEKDFAVDQEALVLLRELAAKMGVEVKGEGDA